MGDAFFNQCHVNVRDLLYACTISGVQVSGPRLRTVHVQNDQYRLGIVHSNLC